MSTTYKNDADAARSQAKAFYDLNTCPECDKPMRRDVRPYTVAYKGLTEVVDMPGWYCDDDCDEPIFESSDLTVSGDSLRRLKAKVAGVLLPDEVKAIRKKLRLSQEKAGEVIGGGENAFWKYESGEVVLSKAVSNLLRVLDAHPAGLEVLIPEKKAATIGEAVTSVEVVEIDMRRKKPQKRYGLMPPFPHKHQQTSETSKES